MMKFIYFYSEIYEYYNKHLQERLKDYFIVEPILIDNLKTNSSGHTFLGGVSIKIELLIKAINENMNNYIIFSDATLFVNSKTVATLNEYIDKFKTHDLCFADNTDGNHNIGFILIKCSDKTLNFFQEVLNELKITKGWDQGIVNKLLYYNTLSLTINKFDREKIVCGYVFNESYRESFYIFKSFIDHTDNIITNYNQRLELFYKLKFIDEIEYTQFLKS